MTSSWKKETIFSEIQCCMKESNSHKCQRFISKNRDHLHSKGVGKSILLCKGMALITCLCTRGDSGNLNIPEFVHTCYANVPSIGTQDNIWTVRIRRCMHCNDKGYHAIYINSHYKSYHNSAVKISCSYHARQFIIVQCSGFWVFLDAGVCHLQKACNLGHQKEK